MTPAERVDALAARIRSAHLSPRYRARAKTPDWETQLRIVELYRGGARISAISTSLGLSRSIVRRVLDMPALRFRSKE